MAAIIELDGVTKRFGDLEAVKHVSIGVEAGEFLTLLGPSGCGKTTTLRLISGFEIPDEGTVAIDGAIVNHLPPFRRDVNTVFQNYALFPHLTVFDNVAYGLTIKRLDKATIRRRVDEMLGRVALAEKASSHPHELSGGEMQRIALARALINEPKVLLLDEPLGALDAKLRRAMQLELKHMQQSLGITFIYVTHDQEEALVMSDRIAVMDGGRFLQLGTPDEVFERPSSRFVADFVGTGNFLTGRIVAVEDGACRVTVADGVTFEVAGVPPDIAVGNEITLAIRPEKVTVMAADSGATSSPNFCQVTLTEVVYLGSLVRLVCRLDDGQTVIVDDFPEQLPFDYRALEPPAAVAISFAAEAAMIYPA